MRAVSTHWFFSVITISSAGTAQIGTGLDLVRVWVLPAEYLNGVEVISKRVILTQCKRGHEDGEHLSYPIIPKEHHVSKCQVEFVSKILLR